MCVCVCVYVVIFQNILMQTFFNKINVMCRFLHLYSSFCIRNIVLAQHRFFFLQINSNLIFIIHFAKLGRNDGAMFRYKWTWISLLATGTLNVKQMSKIEMSKILAKKEYRKKMSKFVNLAWNLLALCNEP